MDKWNYKENISAPRTKGIKYLVVKEKNIKKDFPHLIELTKKDFSLEKVPLLPGKGQEKFLIFKSKY